MLKFHMMSRAESKHITVAVPDDLLREVEALQPGNRSRVVQEALRSYLKQLRRERLEHEAAQLDLAEEEALAEEAPVAGNEVQSDY